MGERLFMEGTNKGLDYLVIAENGMIRLGVKPLLESVKNAMVAVPIVLVGVRLRAAYRTETGLDVVKSEKALLQAWPKVTYWDNKNEARLSVVFGQAFDISSGTKVLYDLIAGDFPQKVAEGIANLIHEEALPLQTADGIREMLVESWKKDMDAAHKNKKPAEEKATGSGADVIDFQAAAVKKLGEQSGTIH